MTTKVVSMTIEDEVVYMGNPEAEFVSLVPHAANRTPFRILKSEKEGGDTMEKSVVAVLIPKTLGKEASTPFLDGLRTDNVRSYDTYKSYVQVEKSLYDQETVEIIRISEDPLVMGIIASLLEKADDDKVPDDKTADDDTKTDGDAKAGDQKEVDYMTMDSLYDQLYAMSDLISGTMRTEGMKTKERSRIILGAVDNFKAFAEALFNANTKQEVSPEAIARHPTSVQDDDSKAVAAKKEEDEKNKKDADDMESRLTTAMTDKISEAVEGVLTTINEKLDGIVDGQEESAKEFTASLKAVREDMEPLLKTPKTGKSEVDDDTNTNKDDDEKSEGDFRGSIFAAK